MQGSRGNCQIETPVDVSIHCNFRYWDGLSYRQSGPSALSRGYASQGGQVLELSLRFLRHI